MYKGYKTYRGYINAKLHALSIVISGDRTVLDQEIQNALAKRTTPPATDQSISTTVLTDVEAVDLYNKLIKITRQQESNKLKAKKILKIDDSMTDSQRKAIISICRYRLNWKAVSTFNYIMKSIPGIKQRLKIKNCNLDILYANLTKKEADTVIKRLDMILKNNRTKQALNISREEIMHEQ